MFFPKTIYMIYEYMGIDNTNHFLTERDVMDGKKRMKNGQNEITIPDDITIIWVNII